MINQIFELSAVEYTYWTGEDQFRHEKIIFLNVIH